MKSLKLLRQFKGSKRRHSPVLKNEQVPVVDGSKHEACCGQPKRKNRILFTRRIRIFI